MMRILENGEQVRMVLTSEFSLSVDTEEDRLRVEEYLSKEFNYANIYKIYMKEL